MIVTYQETAIPTLSLAGLISKVTIAPDERKFIDGTVQKIADVLKIGESITPGNPNQWESSSLLHSEVDRLFGILADEPTSENAERLHSAIVRERDSKDTSGPLNSALRIAWGKLVTSLAPVALGILNRTAELLESEAASVRKSLAAADSVFGGSSDSGIFNRRLEATRQALAAERGKVTAENGALQWLVENQLATNPFALPSTPKAAPVEDVKLTRGRQRLAIEELAGAE